LLKIERITLEGNYVLLRPPLITDEFGLSLAAKDGGIWNNPYAFFQPKMTYLRFCKIY